MRSQPRLGLLALALAAFALPQRTGAHGPAPAVLEVLAADVDGPTWLRATVGLLRRNPDGTWAHVCPAHWDDNDRMQAAVAGDSALVVSATGYRSATDRCEPWTELGPVQQAAADHAAGELHWVRADVLYGDAGELGALPAIGTLTSMVADDGRIAVGGREGLALWDGEWRVIPLPSRLRYLRALTADAVYGTAGIDGRLVPERVALGDETVTLGPPADQLLGPALFGGEMRVFADGEWLAERGGEWVALGTDDRRWTYVDAVNGVTYAASLDGLFRLDDADAPAAEPLFRFVQIAPSPCAVCEPDWAHYGGEAGWLETMAATSPDGERQPIEDGGCSAGGSPGALPWLAPLLLAVIRRRPRSSSAR